MQLCVARHLGPKEAELKYELLWNSAGRELTAHPFCGLRIQSRLQIPTRCPQRWQSRRFASCFSTLVSARPAAWFCRVVRI